MLFNKCLKTAIACAARLTPIFYPPFCAHCDVELEDPSLLLCNGCAAMTTPTNIGFRCRYCFYEVPCATPAVCRNCRKFSQALHSCAAIWDHAGPPATLLNRLFSGRHPKDAKLIAACGISQWHNLNWPIPDLITFVPKGILKGASIGYQPNSLIADSMGELLGCRVKSVLNIRKNEVYLKRNRAAALFDKTVLIVGSIIKTAATFRSCAEALSEAMPRKIFALAACRHIN